MRLSTSGYAISGLALLSLALLGPDCADALDMLGGPGFDEALVAGATLLLVAVSGWALTGITLLLIADGAGWVGRFAQLITPQFLRRAVFIGAAGALAVGPVSAVSDSERSAPSRHASVLGQSLDGLLLPDRPISSAEDDPPATDDSPTADVVTVRRGDTLWSLAARDLGADASDAAIADATTAWHDANRRAIGNDPHLIFPGQHLTPPTKDSR